MDFENCFGFDEHGYKQRKINRLKCFIGADGLLEYTFSKWLFGMYG
jgi:hypothetical protein